MVNPTEFFYRSKSWNFSFIMFTFSLKSVLCYCLHSFPYYFISYYFCFLSFFHFIVRNSQSTRRLFLICFDFFWSFVSMNKFMIVLKIFWFSTFNPLILFYLQIILQIMKFLVTTIKSFAIRMHEINDEWASVKWGDDSFNDIRNLWFVMISINWINI